MQKMRCHSFSSLARCSGRIGRTKSSRTALPIHVTSCPTNTRRNMVNSSDIVFVSGSEISFWDKVQRVASRRFRIETDQSEILRVEISYLRMVDRKEREKDGSSS